MDCRYEFTMRRLCLCERECFFDIFEVNEWSDYVAAEVIRDLLQFQVDLNPANLEEEETITDDIPPQVELRTVKLEPIDPLDIQEAQQEIRKFSIAFTSLESYGPYENTKNNVNDDGKPLLKRRKKVAVDANPGKNDKSHDSAKVQVGKMYIKVRRDCKSPGEMIYMLPVKKSDINRVESSVGELRIGRIKRQEEFNCVDTSVDATVGDEGTLKLNIESENETGGGSERGEDTLLGVNEREGKKGYFRCNDCEKYFEKKDMLTRHLRVHGYEVNAESYSEKRDFQVNINVNCASKHKTSDCLKKGLKRQISDKVKRDEGVRKYVCDLCGKGFSRIRNLEIHLRVHSGEKPFSCDICGKRFSDKSNLGRHKLTHTGVKRYICEVCSEPFANKSYLIKHGRVYTGEKLYKCEICGRSFAHKCSLTRQVHGGEKPYAWEVCNKCFSDRSNLRKHLRIHSQ